MNVDVNHVEALLREVEAQRLAYEQARAFYADQLAPDFSVFDFVRPDEMGLSAILGWLLDPQGTHAQGVRFLQAFVETLELGWPRSWAGKARVRLEATVERGRMDVRVEGPQHVLAIENKPWAGLRPRQLSDYLLDLERFENGCLIFLTGGSRALDERGLQLAGLSTKEARIKTGSKQLIQMSYASKTRTGLISILDWIDDCYRICRADRVRRFLEEFRRYIVSEFEGDTTMSDVQVTTKSILQSPERLEASFAIASAPEPARRELLQMLVADIDKHKPATWVLRDELSGAKEWATLRLKWDPALDYSFGISFDTKYLNYTRFMLGLCLDRERAVDRQAEAQAARHAFPGAFGRTSPWWPCYQYGGRDVLLNVGDNSAISAEPWTKILSRPNGPNAASEMAAAVLALGEKIRDAIAKQASISPAIAAPAPAPSVPPAP